MFNLIEFQEEFASHALGLKSYQDYFSHRTAARSGHSQRGRSRTRRAAERKLLERGYTSTQARRVVQDAVEYAYLLFIAENGGGRPGHRV